LIGRRGDDVGRQGVVANLVDMARR
jgi:hypothetical protein